MAYEGLNEVAPPIHAVCSNLFSLMINTMTNSNLGKERFTWLTYPHHSPSVREVRSGTWKQKTEAEAMEESFYLACSSWLAQPVSL